MIEHKYDFKKLSALYLQSYRVPGTFTSLHSSPLPELLAFSRDVSTNKIMDTVRMHAASAMIPALVNDCQACEASRYKDHDAMQFVNK